MNVTSYESRKCLYLPHALQSFRHLLSVGLKKNVSARDTRNILEFGIKAPYFENKMFVEVCPTYFGGTLVFSTQDGCK